MIEPVQGEGGVRPGSDRFLQEMRAVCDEYGLLMALDEVQTGMGRTGKLWAHEWAGIEPDVMSAAKGIGGGFPLGAVLAKEQVAKYLKPGTHGTTYGGNPLACAAGQRGARRRCWRRASSTACERVAAHLWRGLEGLVAEHPSVVEAVRGRGLLCGLKLKPEVSNGEMQAAAVAEGLLTVAAGMNVLRLAPPLIITEAEADEAVELLDRACLRMTPSNAKVAAK